MAEPADINVDELRRRARRRLVGAVVLALGVAVVVPMLLETEQKPLGEDVSVKIPPIDDGKFVNRLSENRAKRRRAGAAEQATSPAEAKMPRSKRPRRRRRRPRRRGADVQVRHANSRCAVAGAASATPAAPAAPASADNATPRPPPRRPRRVRVAVDAAGRRRTEVRDSACTVTAAAKPASSIAASANKAAAGTSHDGFAVQLAAFADDKGANALAGRLKKAGYTAYTEPLKTSKGTLWRVRVGPYSFP